MLPVLWRFDFNTPVMHVVLYLLAIGLVGYGAYAGWRGAASKQQAPTRAVVFGLISAVVAYYGFGYAQHHGAPLHTYGLMIATAFIVAITLAARECERSYVGVKTLADGTVITMGEYMREVMMDLSFYVLVSGLVGARILFIVTMWKDYSADPLSVFSLSGGLVFYGGFIGAALTVVWYARRHDLNFLRLADVMAPCVSVAHAIGRFGCLSAGCCWGGFAKPGTKWALSFPGPETTGTWAAHWGQSSLAFSDELGDHRLLDVATHKLIMFGDVARYQVMKDSAGNFVGTWMDHMTGAVLHAVPPGALDIATTVAQLGHTLPVYPTQLMESIGELCIFTILVLTRRTKRFHGQILATYLMLYAILRTTVETFRGDEIRGRVFGIIHSFLGFIPDVPHTAWYDISTSQFISIVIFATGVVLWLRYGRKASQEASGPDAGDAVAAA